MKHALIILAIASSALVSCSRLTGCPSNDQRNITRFDRRPFTVKVTRIDTLKGGGYMVHMTRRIMNEIRPLETYCDCSCLPDSVKVGAILHI